VEQEKLRFIINPVAGRGKGLDYEKEIKQRFGWKDGNPFINLTARDGPKSAFNLARTAAREGVEKLVAVGGDGTKNLVMNGLMASNVPLERLPALGFIQAGVGNNFAKNIGTPSDFKEALEMIEKGKTILVDVGELTLNEEKRYFLNVVSFGFDAVVTEITRNLKEKYRLIPKSVTYGLAAVKKIVTGFRSYPVKLTGQGFNLETEATLVAVMNGPTYGAIFRIAPGADLQDGLFDVYTITCPNTFFGKIKAIGILLLAVKGSHLRMPEVRMLKTSSLVISSPENLPCEVDGEVLPAEREYRISVLPNALKVIVPPPLSPSQRPLRSESKAPEPQPA